MEFNKYSDGSEVVTLTVSEYNKINKYASVTGNETKATTNFKYEVRDPSSNLYVAIRNILQLDFRKPGDKAKYLGVVENYTAQIA